MAQPTTSAKIEELRFRLKTDPKSRLFLPLAEELRKISQFGDAEQVLRAGLTHHPTYLSAWVSLGRVSREQNKHKDAVDALTRALTIDPGNVVAARLLGDAWLGLGEHVEAIKKYKLVRALLPSDDEELDAIIQRLEDQIKGGVAAAAAQAITVEPGGGPPAEAGALSETPALEAFVVPEPSEAAPVVVGEPSMPFGVAASPSEEPEEVATADVEPMRVAHSQSPFEDPAADVGYTADAFELEHPPGMHIESAPLAAELPSPLFEDESAFRETSPPAGADSDAEDVFAPSEEPSFPSYAPPPPPDADDFAKTITMADLYAQQGLIDDARDIYEDMLLRDPTNHFVRAKLDALSAPAVDVAAFPVEEEPFGQHYEEPAPEPAPPELWSGMAPPPPEASGAEAPPRSAAARLDDTEPYTRNPKISRLESWLSKVAK